MRIILIAPTLQVHVNSRKSIVLVLNWNKFYRKSSRLAVHLRSPCWTVAENWYKKFADQKSSEFWWDSLSQLRTSCIPFNIHFIKSLSNQCRSIWPLHGRPVSWSSFEDQFMFVALHQTATLQKPSFLWDFGIWLSCIGIVSTNIIFLSDAMPSCQCWPNTSKRGQVHY